MTDPILQRLREIRPADADRVDEIFAAAPRAARLKAIIARAMQSRWQRTRLPAPEAVVVCSGAVQPCVVFDDRCLRQPLQLEVSRSHWWRSQALFQIRDRPPRRRRRPRSCGQRCTLCDPGRERSSSKTTRTSHEQRAGTSGISVRG